MYVKALIHFTNKIIMSFLDRSEARSDCLCAEARARLSAWSVDDVCDFVNSIDICAEYASVSAHLYSYRSYCMPTSVPAATVYETGSDWTQFVHSIRAQ